MQPCCLVVKCLVRDCLRLFRATTHKIINHVRVEFINFIIKGTGHDDIRYVILHCIIFFLFLFTNSPKLHNINQ